LSSSSSYIMTNDDLVVNLFYRFELSREPVLTCLSVGHDTCCKIESVEIILEALACGLVGFFKCKVGNEGFP